MRFPSLSKKIKDKKTTLGLTLVAVFLIIAGAVYAGVFNPNCGAASYPHDCYKVPGTISGTQTVQVDEWRTDKCVVNHYSLDILVPTNDEREWDFFRSDKPPTVTITEPVNGACGGVVNYSLTVTKTGTGSGTITSNPVGIICGVGSACTASFNSGTPVTLTEVPSSGSTFTAWSGGGCSGNGTTCQVTVTANTSVNAAFALGGGDPVHTMQGDTGIYLPAAYCSASPNGAQSAAIGRVRGTDGPMPGPLWNGIKTAIANQSDWSAAIKADANLAVARIAPEFSGTQVIDNQYWAGRTGGSRSGTLTIGTHTFVWDTNVEQAAPTDICTSGTSPYQSASVFHLTNQP